MQPSPTGPTPRPQSRVVDEDYDEGAADALVNLSQYCALEMAASSVDSHGVPTHSPTASSGRHHTAASPRPSNSHRDSISSIRSRLPPHQALRRSSGRSALPQMRWTEEDTPVPSSHPSPVPSHTQPSSRSSESRQREYAEGLHGCQGSSPPSMSVVLPPHPRPIGHSSSHVAANLPPIATLSPASTAPSPGDERMVIDSRRSITPPSCGRLSEVVHPTSGSSPSKPIASPPSARRSHEK
ncbi:hypothetical protein BJ138DRAFT_1199298 [Hygrophoropsis aurantiaca]|uniref:Uncharacterized protein n=1 Tax=Hygrophoropsis aurantiaca TaxID=72124 RepID=A0ACB7ZP40_9AGAM|nr:hypothetical protein BJ138DRAFT_1199298 [Hygrophoropsis aurantiaca]